VTSWFVVDKTKKSEEFELNVSTQKKTKNKKNKNKNNKQTNKQTNKLAKES
jgi:hypothetical protein